MERRRIQSLGKGILKNISKLIDIQKIILYIIKRRIWRNTQVWLKGSVLKTERGVKARGGSNPSSSSILTSMIHA